LIIRHSGGTEGADPRTLPITELEAAGHMPAPLLKIIRHKCLDCCVGSSAEVGRCTAIGCPLWPYRMGANPFRAPRSGNSGSFQKPAYLPGRAPANGLPAGNHTPAPAGRHEPRK
jgi:hypothetical protein